jgi:hypothetical protein
MTGHASLHGRKDLLGSTAHSVLRRCIVPVLVVPLNSTSWAPAIVVGHDGSESSGAALKSAVMLGAGVWTGADTGVRTGFRAQRGGALLRHGGRFRREELERAAGWAIWQRAEGDCPYWQAPCGAGVAGSCGLSAGRRDRCLNLEHERRSECTGLDYGPPSALADPPGTGAAVEVAKLASAGPGKIVILSLIGSV